jgi:hypothetical protein
VLNKSAQMHAYIMAFLTPCAGNIYIYEMKGNTDMHMDGVHTMYFFLCGSTAEIVGVSIYMVGTK